MLYVFTGEREKSQDALEAAVKEVLQKGVRAIRLSDSSAPEDVHAVLGARGMFDAGVRTIVLDGVFANAELRALVQELLPAIAKADDHVFILEEKPDAALRKLLEKHAESVKKFEPSAKEKKEDNFFALSNALQKGDKKNLWLLLQRELALGKAPEAVHGTLFWAAKQLVLKPRAASDGSRGKKLVALLAELPHLARRQGEDLEYALERFALSGA